MKRVRAWCCSAALLVGAVLACSAVWARDVAVEPPDSLSVEAPRLWCQAKSNSLELAVLRVGSRDGPLLDRRYWTPSLMVLRSGAEPELVVCLDRRTRSAIVPAALDRLVRVTFGVAQPAASDVEVVYRQNRVIHFADTCEIVLRRD